MKKFFTILCLSLFSAAAALAQGWPSNYQGVMLQGFYWDSFDDTQWTKLESQADEFAEFFKLIWIPQSGKSASSPSMGYNDLYWFSDYTSSFGNEAELRSMIKTFKNKGIGTIADVVINHRSSLDGTWMSFPEETYKGVTYTMGAADICANDDGGKTAAQAEVKPTGANDSGDDFDGARDLDHSSANVQAMVKAYLDFLLNDLGYTGFRYDMVKGYSASYTGMYNAAANPEFSVGEYWDGNTYNLGSWLNGTKVNDKIMSAAFDFAIKYSLRDACNAGTDWNKLSYGVCMQPDYSRYAVTFVDNHDTYGRNNDSETTKNILAANAFILAVPGTPCVFLPHWKAYKEEIKQMIYARNMAGINNQSTTETKRISAQKYAVVVNGADGHSVVIVMGTAGLPTNVGQNDYFLVSSGDNYAYYISRNVESAWADVPSGTYDNAFSVTLNALSSTAGAQLVYTTDGTEPTASNGTKVADGTKVDVSSDMTLKVALLVGSTVKGVITRTYSVKNFEPYDITVYVNADKVGWSTLNFYTWGGDGSHASADWPGDKVTDKVTKDGKEWYYKTYTMNSYDDYVNFVFCIVTGYDDVKKEYITTQTVDVNNVTTDKYYEISTTMSGEKHKVDDVTDSHTTGIGSVVADGTSIGGVVRVYTIDGRMVRTCAAGTSTSDAVKGLNKGLYIVNGKKVVR